MNTDRFKFRVWDEASGVYCNANGFAIADCGVILRIGNHGTALSLQNSQGLVFEQCTGLKDASGKLMYEGDIIGIPFHPVVKWDYSRSCFVLDDVYRKPILANRELLGMSLIIGNIHENPELLEAHK